jgi:hypothetical protein
MFYVIVVFMIYCVISTGYDLYARKARMIFFLLALVIFRFSLRTIVFIPDYISAYINSIGKPQMKTVEYIAIFFLLFLGIQIARKVKKIKENNIQVPLNKPESN